MALNKQYYQDFFQTYEHIRYGVTAYLQDFEIFAFVSAFGIGWVLRDKSKCQLMTRALFSNVDLMHSIVHSGYTVCVLGKNILQYQGLRLKMGDFAYEGHYNTKLELFVAFVKLEKVKRQGEDADEMVEGYHSNFPLIDSAMLKAVESDNPMVSITLLNRSESERKKPFPYVSRDLIGRMVHSKYDILAIPYLVFSAYPGSPIRDLEFGFNCNISIIDPLIHDTIPANDRPIVHIVFDLGELSAGALEKESLRCYHGWDVERSVGVGYCATQQAEIKDTCKFGSGPS